MIKAMLVVIHQLVIQYFVFVLLNIVTFSEMLFLKNSPAFC